MESYYFTRPILINSTKSFAIYNESGTKVGEIQRFFKGSFQRILNFVFDNWFVNVLVKDQYEKIRAKSEEIVSITTPSTLIRSKWEITLYENGNEKRFYANDKTIIKTNPRIIYEYDNVTVMITKDLGDRVVKFKNENTGKVLATVEYGSFIPPKSYKMKMTIIDPSTNIFEVACLFNILVLGT